MTERIRVYKSLKIDAPHHSQPVQITSMEKPVCRMFSGKKSKPLKIEKAPSQLLDCQSNITVNENIRLKFVFDFVQSPHAFLTQCIYRIVNTQLL